MNTIKGLVREIHRRSLWQVLGIFLAASWGVLQVVDVLTETTSLPDWTPTMALVALLVGLPVCLATAFVQEGMPGRERDGTEPSAVQTSSQDDLAKNLAVGTGSLDRPSTRPSRTRRFLTWRNAMMGGLGAFSLLGLTVTGYFAMWTAGIGPMGNLVAQGVIAERERVVLADFTDATGERIGDAVTEALRVDLREAAVLDLVQPEEIAATLRLMQIEAGTTLTAERARDVARREGIAAVLDGEVASAGSGYLLVATLRAAESGQALASVRATAEGPNEVIASIDLLSQKLREKSGESLKAIRAGQPLEQVTTSSLDALILYTEAMVTQGDARSGELLEQAVARDSTFAMAWRALSLARPTDPAGRAEALSNAFRLRHRLQDTERYLIESLYHVHIDDTRAEEAHQNALRIDPTNRRALNNLAVIYTRRSDLGRAEELLRRIDATMRLPANYSSLMVNQLSLGRIDSAAALMRDFEEASPGHPFGTRARFGLLFAQGDLAAAEAHAREGSEDANLGRLRYWTGRLDEARDLFLRSEVVGGQRNTATAWDLLLATAYEEALVGDPDWARGHVREGLESTYPNLSPSRRANLQTEDAIRLASSGNAEAAEHLLQDWEATVSDDRRGPTTRVRVQRASLYVRVERGDTARAAETMQRLMLEWGCTDACWPFERARLHERLNEPGQAIEHYERVRQPGYPGWATNMSQRLHAMLRLGPLYEEVGDTARAIEAYQRIADQWANGDPRGQETVSRFRERISALGG